MGLLRLDFIDYTTDIDAPVGEVFSFFKEIEKWPDWASGIRKAYRRTPGDWRVGFGIGFVPGFLPLPIQTKVVAFEDQRLIEWGLRTPVATILHRFEFEEAGEGRCRVRHAEHAEGLLALLTRPLRGTLETFDRSLADDLKRAFPRQA